MTTPSPADGLSREDRMVTIERGPDGVPSVWCDPEIVDLVTALNAAGIRTVASCSGHGEQHGVISLKDGRELLIAPDYNTARQMERALLAALRLREWRPIESAPKDGSLYLCWVDAIRYREYDNGQLEQCDVSEVDFGQWRDFETGGAHMNMMGDIGDGQRITHWMPLPAPPPADDLARVLEEGE